MNKQNKRNVIIEWASDVPPGADGFESQSRQVRLLPAHGAKPGVERSAEMERLTQPGHEYHSLEFMEDGIYIYMNRLREYEDTGLTPEQIRELKERDTAKAPDVHKNKFSDAYTCPNCNLVFIHKDTTGWFCGKQYKFCPDCGQRIKWEN